MAATILRRLESSPDVGYQLFCQSDVLGSVRRATEAKDGPDDAGVDGVNVDRAMGAGEATGELLSEKRAARLRATVHRHGDTDAVLIAVALLAEDVERAEVVRVERLDVPQADGGVQDCRVSLVSGSSDELMRP